MNTYNLSLQAARQNEDDKHQSKKRTSLVSSLTRTLFLGLAIVFALMTVMINMYGGVLLRNIANERVSYILSSQARNSANLLWDFELEKIKIVLDTMIQDRYILAARVNEASDSGFLEVESRNWDVVNKNSIIESADIIYYPDSESDGRVLGNVEVVLDYSSIETQLNQAIMYAGIIFLGTFFAFGVIIYFSLKRAIEPISKLSEVLVDADYFNFEIKSLANPAKEVNDLFNALTTMQKIMRNQLSEIENQRMLLDTTLEKMPLGMYVEDIKNGGELVLVNNMFKMLFGLREKFCVGMDIDALLTSDQADFMDNMNDLIIFSKKRYVEESCKTKTENGKPFVFNAIKTSVNDEHGQVALIITMVQDVTQEYEARQNIIAARDSAERAREEAERAGRAKSEFLANMSHELRTPLNSIIGLTNILVDDDALVGEQKEMLDTVLKASDILLNTVNDILDLSKIEVGSIKLEGIPYDLKKGVDQVVDTLKPLCSKGSVLLHSKWEGVVPTVMGDPVRIERIITNLVANAIKFTEEGEVLVSVKTELRADDIVLFECAVKDTGVGIPQEKFDHIFEKFAQADASTTRKFGGTGLGLAITRQLVELMDGTITVDSELGKGSTFTISIPFFLIEGAALDVIEADDDIDKISDAHNTHKPISSINVLVAEDQKMNQMLMNKMLPRLGVQKFIIANDGLEAVEFFKKEKYDLIIMDCHMPNLNGFDATRAIRNYEDEEGLEAIPIIAMTADAMVGTRESCIEAGMSDYISKPVQVKKFEEVLGDWFDLKS